jgi:hypothetical protein
MKILTTLFFICFLLQNIKLNDFENEYDNPEDRHVPIVATIGVLIAYIFAGALIFSFTENWRILDGAYFW